MISRSVALLLSYVRWGRRLPQATESIFTARSPLGRSIKIFLFGVGVILPLGSLIWALLYWHGCSVRRSTATREHAVPIACEKSKLKQSVLVVAG